MHVAHPVGVVLHNAALQRGGGGLVALDEYLEAHAGAEQAAFAVWLDGVYSKWQRAQLNHFEHNIQVWMQLWHTIASSTVVCLVADARNPIWHIPPSLVNEVVSVMKKPLLIALSKCDLVPEDNVRAWTQALRARFPAAAAIVPFSATGLLLGGVRSIAQRRRELKDARVKKSPECLKRVADSVSRLLLAAGGHAASVALAARRVMVVGGGVEGEGEGGGFDDEEEEEEEEEGEDDDEDEEATPSAPLPHSSALSAQVNVMCLTKAQQRKARKDKRKAKQKQRVPVAVTLVEEEMARLAAALQEKGQEDVVIGMIGHPNAGKSSIINAMCSKKVVSVSRCVRNSPQTRPMYSCANASSLLASSLQHQTPMT
jgi:GTP-binding protein EngB required for normal cell division